MMLLKLIKMMIELLNTDSFMIRYPLLMHPIDSFQAINANPTIEIALLIYSYQMIMLIMSETGLHLRVHEN